MIGYDGSVLKWHPTFRKIMSNTMLEVLHEKKSRQRFNLIESTDGSGRGAAVVAAVACREKRPLIAVRKRRDKYHRMRTVVTELNVYPELLVSKGR